MLSKPYNVNMALLETLERQTCYYCILRVEDETRLERIAHYNVIQTLAADSPNDLEFYDYYFLVFVVCLHTIKYLHKRCLFDTVL